MKKLLSSEARAAFMRIAAPLGGSVLLLASGIAALVIYLNTLYLPWGLAGILLSALALTALALFINSASPAIRIIRAVLSFLFPLSGGALAVFMYRRLTSVYSLSWLSPVLCMVLFAVFVIAEKLCMHKTGEGQREQALSRTVHSFLASAGFSLVLMFAVSVLKLLGLWDGQKYLVWALYTVMAYVFLFAIVTILFRLVRRELAGCPDISVPVPFSGRKDLNFISYLEQSTGITVRSLWSIKFIKFLLPYAALLVILTVWAGSCFHEIGPNEQGALYRCGSLSDSILEPGLHLTLPWPFDTVEKYETGTVRKMTVGYKSDSDQDNIWTESHGTEEFKLLLGGGNELVSVNLRIEYRISDLKKYLSCASSPENIMQGLAYELITDTVIRTDLDSLMSRDRSDFAADFEAELSAKLKDADGCGDGIGLETVSVVLESIHPPVDVAAKYQELISAEIQAEEYILEAESYAAIKTGEAETSRNTAINTAVAAKYTKLAEAEASVSSFMAAVAADSENSDAYRYHKYLEALAKAYGNARLVLVGSDIDKSCIWLGNLSDLKN